MEVSAKYPQNFQDSLFLPMVLKGYDVWENGFKTR